MLHHRGRKNLRNGFDQVWEKLHSCGKQTLTTAKDKVFIASAATLRSLSGEKFIKIEGAAGQEFARIYECCWGHTVNHYSNGNGTRIGGYSDALDNWAG